MAVQHPLLRFDANSIETGSSFESTWEAVAGMCNAQAFQNVHGTSASSASEYDYSFHAGAVNTGRDQLGSSGASAIPIHDVEHLHNLGAVGCHPPTVDNELLKVRSM